MPYQEMAFIARHATTLSAVIAINGTRLVLEGDNRPISAQFVTSNFFSELGGTRRLLGRVLDPADRRSAPTPRPPWS